MKMTSAESLALETYLTRFDYEATFKENLLMLSDLSDYRDEIGIREYHEHLDLVDLIEEIRSLAYSVQKTIGKELKKVNQIK